MSNLAYGTFTITNLSTVTSVDVYYYNSTSSTSLSGGSWSTNTPTWTNGRYIWSKTVTTWEQGVTTESEPVCITGQKGSTGAAGQSVTRITQQYALGTSSTTAPTSGWSTTMPTFESGKFYWTRSEIVWANPTSTTYTTAVLANGLTSANNNAEVAKTDAASAVSTANTANQTANTANQTANAANQTAQNAVSIANGKNTIYYSSSKPTGGTYKAGDTWFNLTTDGYRLYEYDATAKDWVQKSMDGKSITAGTVTAAQIHAGAITTDKLATNAIKSANYNAGTAPYSLTGTFLDLSNGNIFTPNFGVNNDSTDNIDNGAYIKGTIQAYDGKIGSDNNNYWYIGNYFDYNQGQSAMIRSHGTAAIQLGDSSTWRLSTNRIHTAWNDDSTSGEAFRLHYPSYGGKYWDSGLHVPASATDKLLYIRNAATSTSLENLQNDIDDNSGGNYWKYQFYLTNDGSLYAKNIYIMDDNGGIVQIGGTDGVYLLKSGGTISGNLEITGTLKMQGNFLNKSGSAITLQTNLASTSAVTLTGNSTSPIKLGVTGTLPVANGGTGNTNYTSGGIVYVSNTSPKTLLSNAAGTSGQLLASGGSGVPTWVNASSLTVAAATKATQDGNGKVIATTYLPLTGGNVTGPVNFGDSVSIDDLTAGALIVTGNSSFTNNAQFNTINGVAVGSNPKFTDTITTVSTTGSGNAVTAITASNGAITVTKGTTFLTGITSSQVTSALGYTPYNSTNPNGYTTNTGTVTQVTAGTGLKIGTASSGGNITTTGTINHINSVTVQTTQALYPIKIDAQGHISAYGSAVTSWALSAITGADDLKAIEALTGTSGFLKKTAANTWGLDTNTYLTGITSSQITTALGYTPYDSTNPDGYTNNVGTVTSVAASGSGGITISGSPITTSGTIAIGLNLSTAINGLGEGSSPANRNDYIVAQYAGGGTTTTSYHRRKLSNIFAALIADDIPGLAWSKITSGNDDLKAIENLTGTTGLLKKTAANTWTLDTSAYVTSSGVTSITLTQGTGISIGSSGTAITSTGTRTISLADNYGDTKNPYASKTARYVLAAPAAQAGAPTFRALTNADVGLSNVTNNKQVKGLSSGTTSGNLVTWGSDGYTVADSGIAKGSVATKITLSGTDYTVSSNIITITKANLQSAIQDTSLVLMTAAERSKLSSIKVSEGGTIDFSGVTASAPITATVNQTTKAVNITHNTSGVSAGTYRSVTVNTYGHVTAGTNPTTLSGYGITDAKIASGVITLGSNTITPLTASSTLDATKLSGTASISTTGNATTATKFSSNRSIALSGDTTGSASSNGESGWSITTKTSKMTTLADNRSVATTPNDYKNQIIFQGLKANSYINSPSNAVYSYLVGLRGWSDNSGGNAHELAFNDNGIFRRNGATDTWGSWYKLIDSGNYNSYSPTLTGTGASGTWDIDIGGNAVTATSATSAASATKATKDGDGNTISSTYLKLSGGTVTGITQFNKTIRDANGQHYYGGAANRSQWYKITLAHNGVVPPTTDNQWYMCSMTIHMAGDYNICPRGTIELCYYIFWDKTKYNADKVYATGYGPNINKAKVYYNLTDPFVLYIDSSNPYTSIWVDYVSYRDSAQSHNSKETKVEITNAITIADYTVVPTTYLYTTNGNYFYTSTHLRPTSNNTLNLGDSSYKWANIYATTFNGALNGNATKATQDSDGNQINTTYLKLAGGTMTGVLNAKRNEYEDSYSGALNMNNSNIYGLNSIYTSDTSDSSAEGIHFYRDTTHVDSIHAKSGVLYFTPNRPLGEVGTSYSIYHTGNKPSKTDVGLGNVENTALSTWAGSSNITTLGTISSGTIPWARLSDVPNYAGSSSKGGAATSLAGFTNTTTSATAIDNATQNGHVYVNGTSTGTNNIYGISDGAAFVQAYSTNWVAQIYQDYRTGQIALRGKNNGTWQAWRKVLDSTSYTDYTVTKTGSGASGTWGISVTGTAANVTGTVAVANGGTGATSFTSGELLIGNGSNAIGTRSIKNITAKGNLGWTAAGTDVYIPTINTLAYWNGAYSGTNSNLTYCVKGAFGDAAIKGVVTTLDASANLPTASAVKTYVDTTAQNTYVTLSTAQTITGRKTFNDLAAVTFKPSSGTDKCNINYDASLGALVFSF